MKIRSDTPAFLGDFTIDKNNAGGGYDRNVFRIIVEMISYYAK